MFFTPKGILNESINISEILDHEVINIVQIIFQTSTIRCFCLLIPLLFSYFTKILFFQYFNIYIYKPNQVIIIKFLEQFYRHSIDNPANSVIYFLNTQEDLPLQLMNLAQEELENFMFL